MCYPASQPPSQPRCRSKYRAYYVAQVTIVLRPTRPWKEFDDMRIRFDTIPVCDGQTDGHTDGFAVAISLSSCVGMLMRDKTDGSSKYKSDNISGHTVHFQYRLNESSTRSSNVVTVAFVKVGASLNTMDSPFPWRFCHIFQCIAADSA